MLIPALHRETKAAYTAAHYRLGSADIAGTTGEKRFAVHNNQCEKKFLPMERRDYLKIAGAGGIAALGAYGAYTTVVRDAWSDPDAPPADDPLAYVEDDELEDIERTAETRQGWKLMGITPEARDLTVLDPFEEWLEKRHAVVGFFLDVGQPSVDEIQRITNSLFEAAWQRNQIPHIFWQPFLPEREETSENINREIANGEWDDVITAWARSIGAWLYDPDGDHGRVYLNLAPEFNGDWSPWSPAVGEDDEDDFVEMWRRFHDIFEDLGIDERFVQWIWTVDNTTRGVDREACYPGDDYVDWCGIHGYNWASWTGWQQPPDVYDESIAFLEGLTDKPIAITEFASSSETNTGDHDPAMKDEWLTDAYAYLREHDVRMSLYFDLVKETDWAVFGGPRGTDTIEVGGGTYDVYPAYKEAMSDGGVLGPHPDHPRVLTQDEFAGDF